jgi:hypothetical protein
VASGARSDGLATSAEVSASEINAMAELEHASWMDYLYDSGWRYGAERDDRRRLHPSLRPWLQLTPEDQAKTRDGVANALRILNRLGCRSTVLRPQVSDGGSTSAWLEVMRRGEVTAVRRDAPWTWTNGSGVTMQANAGDWQVSNDAGRSWSVDSEIFASTYSHIAGDGGDVRAALWPGRPL